MASSDSVVTLHSVEQTLEKYVPEGERKKLLEILYGEETE